jgi:hypothetical protein
MIVGVTTAAARALAIFEAFLQHARAGAPSAAPDAPRPRVLPRGEPDEATRVVSMPSRTLESTWDDPTEEKPPTASLPASSVEPATDVSVRLPEVPAHAHAMEQSVIIDDDSLTQPEMGRDLVQVGVRPEADHAALGGPPTSDLDGLLVEMAVLVKYGHAPTAALVLDRWALAHPDDLHGQMRVAEFEMARIDREVALRRYGTLVSLFLDRGDLRAAGDVMRRLRRDLPGDPRVAAIAQWNGLDA